MLVTRSHIFLALLVAITGTSAQNTTNSTSIGNFTTCGQHCLTNILSGSVCKTITNVTCICAETTVQTSLGSCLKNCSAADLTEGESLEKNLCSNNTTTTSLSASQASVTKTGSSSSSTSTSTSSSSGNKAASPVERLPLISAIITIAGVVIGGAFAL